VCEEGDVDSLNIF